MKRTRTKDETIEHFTVKYDNIDIITDINREVWLVYTNDGIDIKSKDLLLYDKELRVLEFIYIGDDNELYATTELEL